MPRKIHSANLTLNNDFHKRHPPPNSQSHPRMVFVNMAFPPLQLPQRIGTHVFVIGWPVILILFLSCTKGLLEGHWRGYLPGGDQPILNNHGLFRDSFPRGRLEKKTHSIVACALFGKCKRKYNTQPVVGNLIRSFAYLE